MKIVNVMTSKVLGGIEQAFLDYNKALSLKNHKVINIINKNAKIKSKISNETIDKIIEIPFVHYNYFLIPYLYFKLKKENVDIFIVHNKKAIPIFKYLAKLLKVKIVGVSHNPKYKYIDKCDAIFTITDYQKEIFINKGFNKNRIFTIPNSIDVNSNINHNQIKAQETNSKLKVGVLGRFDPMKGFPDFIKALSILKKDNIPFVAIIGGAPQTKNLDEYNKVKSLVKELNLEEDVQFLGWIEDKTKFFNYIDIFVLPSFFEPFGIVLLEAMLHSKPIVSSLAEGPSEIFKDNKDCAYLFPIKDYEEMAAQIKKAIINYDITKKIGINGYNLCIKNYSTENISHKINDALLEVIK